VLVQGVQHFFRLGFLLEDDHQPHAAAIGFVAHIADALNLALLGHLGDTLLQARLVDLVG
jgi:hypothetical protein